MLVSMPREPQPSSSHEGLGLVRYLDYSEGGPPRCARCRSERVSVRDYDTLPITVYEEQRGKKLVICHDCHGAYLQ